MTRFVLTNNHFVHTMASGELDCSLLTQVGLSPDADLVRLCTAVVPMTALFSGSVKQASILDQMASGFEMISGNFKTFNVVRQIHSGFSMVTQGANLWIAWKHVASSKSLQRVVQRAGSWLSSTFSKASASQAVTEIFASIFGALMDAGPQTSSDRMLNNMP